MAIVVATIVVVTIVVATMSVHKVPGQMFCFGSSFQWAWQEEGVLGGEMVCRMCWSAEGKGAGCATLLWQSLEARQRSPGGLGGTRPGNKLTRRRHE